jgi:hypothetical protein
MLFSKLFRDTVNIRLALRLTDTFIQDKLKLYTRACEFYIVFISWPGDIKVPENSYFISNVVSVRIADFHISPHLSGNRDIHVWWTSPISGNNSKCSWFQWPCGLRQVCSRLVVGIARSHSAEGIDVRLLLTCICLRRRLFCVTFEISRTVPWYRDVTAGTLTATDTYALRMHMCGRE